MARWIVAGILLVVLVGAVVMDELGWDPFSGQSPQPTAEELADVASGDVTGEDAVPAGPDVEGVEGGPGPDGDPIPPDEYVDTDQVYKSQVDDACAPVVARLRDELGEEGDDLIGSALWEGGLKPQQIRAFCKEVADLPTAEVAQRAKALADD